MEPGAIFAAIVACAFNAVAFYAIYRLFRRMGRGRERRRLADTERKSGAYAADFRRQEAEFEASLKKTQ